MNARDKHSSPSIAYACSYMPVELIVAAGLTPARLVPEPRPSEGDAYMHPNTCHYVKSLLAEALSVRESIPTAVIFANCCDGMRRLHDVWNENAKHVSTLFMDIPKKNDPASIEFFASELRRSGEELERLAPGSRITDKSLNDAIRLCNEVRRLMGEVFQIQMNSTSSNVTGMSVFELCLEAIRSHPGEMVERLREFVSSPEGDAGSRNGSRILLTGSVIHRPDLVSLIEDLGGRVVALDTCIGARHYDGIVEEETADPMGALAERYLLRAPCARMEAIEDRFQYMKGLVDKSGAQGVVYSPVKFCDLNTYEAPFMRNTFEDAGVPLLVLENDYAWSGLEQMKVRVEAFLSMIWEGGSSQNV